MIGETTATFAPALKEFYPTMGSKVGTVMGEFKRGQLHSGSRRGAIVRKKSQALAIALSEARDAGEDVPQRRKGSSVVRRLLDRR